MSALRLMLRPIRHGWSVQLSDGRELAGSSGPPLSSAPAMSTSERLSSLPDELGELPRRSFGDGLDVSPKGQVHSELRPPRPPVSPGEMRRPDPRKRLDFHVAPPALRAEAAAPSRYLRGIPSEEIISTVHGRRAPMMHASAGLDL